MKIFFYINVLGGGGAERVIANLANQLTDTNNEVAVVTSYLINNEYTLNSRVKRFQLEECTYQDNFIRRNIRRVYRLRKILKKERPDILISFMAEPNYRAVLATVGLPTKTLISVRNDPNMEYIGKIGSFLAKNLLIHADGCVFQTSEAMEWFPQKLQKKSRIIYNAVRPDFYSVEREPIKGRVVSCGRLSKQKNYSMLIKAFEEVVKKNSEAILCIYGEGDLKKELENEIESKNLQNRVFLKGSTNNVPAVLKNAEVFVLSSDYEGMPNALMEALTVGIPCVATDCPCGGPRMLIENEKNGILVPVNDSMHMADALEKVLSNEELADRLGKKARKSAVAYQSDKVFSDWLRYISEIVNG